jgi:hypothetical protein
VTIDQVTFNTFLSLCALLGAIYVGVSRVGGLGEKFGQLQLKVDTMWDVLMKGAIVAARRTGVLQENSPVRLNPEVAKHFGELGYRIKAFYAQMALAHLTDSEVVLILARTFGDEIMERVGTDLLPNFGAALIAALQLCKEGLPDA